MRRGLKINAVRPTGKDDARGGLFFNGFDPDLSERHDLSIDPALAHAPCDELVILPSEINYHDFLISHNVLLKLYHT